MKKFSFLFILIAASLWGSMGLFVRNINSCGFSSMEVVAVRAIGAFVTLFLLLLVFRPSLLKIKFRDLWIFFGTGILSITFFNYCYFTTITRTSLSVAAVLLYTAPSFVILFSAVLFREKIILSKLAALVLSFLGCALVSGIMKNTLNLQGIDLMIGIGAGLGYALYSIFGRFALNRGYPSLTIICYTFFFSGLGVLPFIHLPDTLQKINENPGIWTDFISMVLIVTVAAYLLYTIGLSYMDSGKASILACIEPVVATLLGALLYKESLDFWEGLGIILVLSATLLINLGGFKKKELLLHR